MVARAMIMMIVIVAADERSTDGMRCGCICFAGKTNIFRKVKKRKEQKNEIHAKFTLPVGGPDECG